MRRIIPFIAVLALLNACVKNNPDPAWIEINEWQLVANPNSQDDTGQLTENFSDAWVYVGNKLMGVFELPVKIPVLFSGSTEIRLFPAVRNNGISATKKIYPFVKSFDVTMDLVQNETVTLNPQTEYHDNVQFWIEDFEDASLQIQNDPNTSQVNIGFNNDAAIIQPFNESRFGRVSLDATNSLWVGYTNQQLQLPKAQEVYLEIDYHNTNRLITGVLGIGSSGVKPNPNIQLNPQNDGEAVWKKIYIDLREIVSNSPEASYFEISFEAPIDEGASAGEINIDNIKVLHF